MRRRDDDWPDGAPENRAPRGGRDGEDARGRGAGYPGYPDRADDAGYGRHRGPVPGYAGPGYPGAGADNGRYGRFPVPPDTHPDAGEFPVVAGSAPARSGTPRPYGRLSIFTLLDDKEAEFDRLAEEAAEGVRTSEPDTLVYVIHVVPKAPMQRIIYEVYRDRAAFEDHERQPHIRRFAAERSSCVLATNLIDLRLKYAKVAAIFSPDRAVQRPRSGQHEAGQHQGYERYASGSTGYGEDRDGWFGGDRGGRHVDGSGATPAGGPPWQEAPGWEPPPYPRRRQGGAR